MTVAALQRVGWFVFLVVVGIPMAVVTVLTMAFGVLIGTHTPYRRGLTIGVEKVED